jgi:hypothetical protein
MLRNIQEQVRAVGERQARNFTPPEPIRMPQIPGVPGWRP